MTDNSEALATARAWMQRYPVVDGIGAGPASEQAVVDLVAGGVDAVHWSVGGHAEIASWCHSPLAGTGDTTKSALLNMVLHRWLVRRLPDQCVLARSVADIEAARRNSRTAIIHGWQGAQPIEENPSLLEIFYELGLRIVQIHHNYETSLGFGCYEPRDHGLKRSGFDVLAACNQLGIVVDGSHTGEQTALDMIDASSAPLIFSHSNPNAVCEHPRNISDRLINACAARGGVIGCNVFSDFVADTSDGHWPSVDDWVHCIDHVVDTVGIEHVAIGSDLCMHPHGEVIWDSSTWGGARKPFAQDEIQGMEHTHRNFARLIVALVGRGYLEDETAKIMGGNWLRVYGEVWGG